LEPEPVKNLSGVFAVDLNDFRQQIIELKKIGPVRDSLAKIPGVNWMSMGSGDIDIDREINCIQAILDSMTPQERSYPVLMTVPQRCLRIADGAGVEPSEVSSLFTQFQSMRDMMSRFELGRLPHV